MGLDQYAYSVKQENAVDDFTVKNGKDAVEIAYWRKLNALQGWMQRLYEAKGGDMKNGFNCDKVRLTVEDIMNLQKAVLSNDEFVPTQGFFFGIQEVYDEDRLNVLEFCAKALYEIYKGNAVYYDSWW